MDGFFTVIYTVNTAVFVYLCTPCYENSVV